MRAVFSMSRFRPFSGRITSRKNGWLYGYSDDEYDVYRPLHMALDGWLYASHSFGQVLTSGKSVFNAIRKSGYLLPEIERNSATLKRNPGGSGGMFPIDAIAGDDKLVFFRPGSPPPGAGAFFFSARELILDFGGKLGQDLLSDYKRTLERTMANFGLRYQDWVDERMRVRHREFELLDQEKGSMSSSDYGQLHSEIYERFDPDLRWAILELPQAIVEEFYVRVQKLREDKRSGGIVTANFVDSLTAQQSVGYPTNPEVDYAEKFEITVEGRVPIDAAFGWMYAVNDDRSKWEFGFREEFYPYDQFVELLDRATAMRLSPDTYFLDDVVNI